MRLFLLSTALDGPLGTQFLKKHIPEKEVSGKKILVISVPWENTDRVYLNNCLEWGFEEENIVLSEVYDPQMGAEFDYVYVTAGNTFEILQYMRQKGLCQVITQIAEKGTYVGASAGAIIAGTDIHLAADFDENRIGMPVEEQQGLELFEGTIIPHQTFTEHRYYLESKSYQVRDSYKKIYYVADNEGMMLIQNPADGSWKEKRLRWDWD